jgi:uncharacterized protein (DUF1697 family)
MTTFVALLRAVNVGGQNKIPMAELRQRLSAIGLDDVRTYVQSGNVVFTAEGDDPGEQAATVHDVIEQAFDADVQVLALTAEQMAHVKSGNPFFRDGVDEKHLHVTFLFAPVKAAAFADLELPAEEGEEAALGGEDSLADRIVYLHLPHGYGRSKLGNPWFERVLKTPATSRNWRTVVTLAKLSSG